MEKFFDSLVNQVYKSDTRTYQKAKLVIKILLILSIACLLGGLTSIAGTDFNAFFMSFCVLNSLLIGYFVYLFKENKISIANVTNIPLFSIVLIINFDFFTTTDVSVNSSYFLSLLPLLSLLILGKKSSKIWLLLITLNNTINVIIKSNSFFGVKTPAQYDGFLNVVVFLIFSFLVFGVSIAFENAKESVMQELEDEKKTIQNKVDDAVREVEAKNSQILLEAEKKEEINNELEKNKSELIISIKESEEAKKDLEVSKKLIEKEQQALENSVEIILEKMNEFASGDLTVSVDSKELDVNNNSIIKLFEGFNLSVVNINQLFTRVVELIEETKKSSETIMLLTQQISSGTEEQLTKTNQIALASESLATTTEQNAHAILITTQNSNKNKDIANSGGSIVFESVKTMNEIENVVKETLTKVDKLSSSTFKISEVISVIDGIANQTNLLALNAAIEAARAGEHGRGFAVVAGEVRKLSEKTTLSTKEIEQTIKVVKEETEAVVSVMKEVTKRVNKGIKLTNNAGEALEKIVKSSEDLLVTMEQISVSTEENAATTKQIVSNILEIDEVSHESVKDINFIYNSASNLNNLISELKELSLKFKV